MRAHAVAVVACLLGMAATADLVEGEARCRVPAVNKRGFRPHAVVA